MESFILCVGIGNLWLVRLSFFTVYCLALCATCGSKFGELFMAIGNRDDGTFVFTS